MSYKTKTCNKCHIEKPITDFFKGKSPDGYCYLCKACCYKYTQKYRKSSPENYAKFLCRKRNRNADKERLYRTRYRKRHKEEVKAQNILNCALRKRGSVIKRESCYVCDDVNSQAHHFDYNKPLEVIWVCPKHHKSIHKIYKLFLQEVK
jgi:hypothetical protein